jgi:transposase-like protein/DDE family transposase
MPPAQWARKQFAQARLGDRRRTQRLVEMATRLAQCPTGTLPQAFPDWKDLKAAYRFLDHLEFGPQQVQQPHWQKTLEACRQAGEHLVIEDTTTLDYSSHRRTEQLGFIGNGRGRGILLHSTLAVRVEGWASDEEPQGLVVGLLGQKSWIRTETGLRYQNWRQRLSRRRESDRWAKVLDWMGRPTPGCHWIYMGDRESDFYEPIQRCARNGLDFIIRAFRDRKLAEGNEHLFEALAQAPVQGVSQVEVRGRNGEAARQATVSLRSCRVRLQGPWRPQGRQEDIEVNVVEALEVATPPGVQPLHWILLTSLPCRGLAALKRIVARYGLRWWIEQYHKALKSGAGVEESQLEKGFRLENLAAVLAVVAVRLVNTQWLARNRPDEPVEPQSFGANSLKILSAKFGAPKGGWTNRTVLIAVARIGGFLARKHDGMPGWQTIWRGWSALMYMCEGVEILKPEEKRCG